MTFGSAAIDCEASCSRLGDAGTCGQTERACLRDCQTDLQTTPAACMRELAQAWNCTRDAPWTCSGANQVVAASCKGEWQALARCEAAEPKTEDASVPQVEDASAAASKCDLNSSASPCLLCQAAVCCPELSKFFDIGGPLRECDRACGDNDACKRDCSSRYPDQQAALKETTLCGLINCPQCS